MEQRVVGFSLARTTLSLKSQPCVSGQTFAKLCAGGLKRRLRALRYRIRRVRAHVHTHTDSIFRSSYELEAS